MPYGYNGRILRVDLSTGTTRVEELDELFYRRYLGGAALASYFLLREQPPGVDPRGPENRLIFATGVFTGAPASGNGRNTVAAKSPLSGGIARSEVGGFWGAEFKHAGYDALIVEGAAESPVYLWIDRDGGVEIRDARHLWGMEPKESLEAIRAEVGEKMARAAQIGPAGEKMVRFGVVTNDLRHTAGRGGLGAVMGSKKLKAIAVRSGKGPEMADPGKIKELARYMADNIGNILPGLHELGTGANMLGFNLAGNIPTRNFRDGPSPGTDRTIPQVMKSEGILVDMESCYACAVRCKRVARLESPYQVDPEYGGAEYETLAAFGADCGVDDIAALARAHHLCQAYGLDSISAGSTIAFAMEAFENGLLSISDTDGIDLRFGNADAMLEMMGKITRREGVGDLLAEGTRIAAQKIGRGAEKLAMHVKGVELGLHEPRLKFGLALGYSVAAIGGDHALGYHDTNYEKAGPGTKDTSGLGFLEPMPANELSSRKAAVFAAMHKRRQICECMVCCELVPWTHNQLAELVSACTGWNTTVYELMMNGERAITLQRAFNLREGLTAADDTLPERMFAPPAGGPLERQAVDRDALKLHQRIYYRMMGWDPETSVPAEWKLEELGIGWVKEILERQGLKVPLY
jgi:aldehyde:ferredoxin oxidoreductase